MSSPSPFIVKKVKKVSGGGHHGGSWKIAYADFVTAMMAFFLLMWLTIAAGGKALNAISAYFKQPLLLSLRGGTGSGDRTAIIKGGGTDLTRTAGQVHNGQVEHQHRFDEKAAAEKAKANRQEVVHLKGLQIKLQSTVNQDKFLKKFKNQLRMDLTNEGLRIQIVDEKNRPLFDSGSAHLQPYAKKILDQVARALNMVPNKISISGHTDAKPFKGRNGYSNWDLSADRANACRRELIAGGMDPDKVLRVIGQASAVPLDAKDPFAAVNRRISIIVLNEQTERGIEKMSGTVTMNSKGDVVPLSQQKEAEPATAQPADVTPATTPSAGSAPATTQPAEPAAPAQETDSVPPPVPPQSTPTQQQPQPTDGTNRHHIAPPPAPSGQGSSNIIPLPPITAIPPRPGS